MRCPTDARLARAASGEDEGALRHADECPRCGAAIREAIALRELAADLPSAPLVGRRRQVLADAVLAMADAEPPPRDRRAWRAVIWSVPLAAAAAAALAIGLREPAQPIRSAASPSPSPSLSPSPSPSLSPSASPSPSPSASPSPSPSLSPRLRPSVTGLARADYHVVATDGEERLVLRAGRVTVDGAIAPDHPVRVVTSTAEIRAVGARFEARGDRGALRAVRVFAGTVEIVAGARVIVVGAGETWTLTGRPTAAAAAPATTSHFRAGWDALRAGRFAAAAAALERARTEPGVEEDAAYWSAVAWARAGDDGRARDAFVAFLAAHPDSPRAGEAHLALARLLIAAGQRDAAAPHLDAAARDADPRLREAASRLAAPASGN